MWMAGGGDQGRHDRRCNRRRQNAEGDRGQRVNDIHATILHLLGLDHKQLTFLHNGRDERLTDVGGRVSSSWRERARRVLGK